MMTPAHGASRCPAGEAIFVDPIENLVTRVRNSVQILAPDGTITPQTGPSGQVYAGTVNGVTVAPTLVADFGAYGPFQPGTLHV